MQNKNYYLTKEGLTRTREELDSLRKLRARKIRKEIPEVFHSEDINPEYLNFRRELGFLESKIIKLEQVLRNAEIIKKPKGRKKEVCLGSLVTVEANGQVDNFNIVGTMEADPAQDKISNESLVGSALMGAKEGDEIIVSSAVRVVYKIKKISYIS